jgi:hypothetical protein
MTNYEFYKDEIEMRYREGKGFALTKSGKIIMCRSNQCGDCCFSRHVSRDSTDLSCGDRKMMWAVQEYTERPKLTKHERKFCELLEGKDAWIARDMGDKTVTVYKCRPDKRSDFWAGRTFTCSTFIFEMKLKFDFIQWEDGSPWSVDELLKLEVEE